MNEMTLVFTCSCLLQKIEKASGFEIERLTERLQELTDGRTENLELALNEMFIENHADAACHAFGAFAKQIGRLAALLGRIAVDDQKTQTLTVIGSDNVLDF